MAKAATKTPALSAEAREERGSTASKRLRKAGQIPAVLYGRGKDNVSLKVADHDLQAIVRRGAHGLVRLQVSGKGQNVLIKEMQWDPYGERIQHVDFIRVTRGEAVTVEVPLVLRGDAPGVNEGGILEQRLYAIELDCPVEAIPEAVEVNINDLHLGQEITLGQVELPDQCSVHREHHEEAEEEEGVDPLEQLVVGVSHPIEEAVEEEAVAAETAEPEVISERKEEETPEEG